MSYNEAVPLPKALEDQRKRLAKLQIKSCLTFRGLPCLMHIPTRKCIVRYQGTMDPVWIFQMNAFIKAVEENKLDKYDTR